MKMSEEEVRKEASLNKYILDDRHFEVKAKVEKREKRGRPKKAKKEVESGNVKDLFAELIGEVDVVDDVVELVNDVVVNELVNDVVVKENKPEKKQLEKEAKKAEKEAKKEAKKESKKAEKEAEKEAKKESKKLEKKEAKKLEKESKKEAKKAKKAENLVQPFPKVDLAQPFPNDEDSVKVTVTRFEFEGKQYLRSTENILYDPDSKEEMGIFCEETKSIKALPEGECEEEEYDNL